MAEWVSIVQCPHCFAKKEAKPLQKRWKCPECKQKWGVKDTLWRSMKRGGKNG